MNFEKEVIKFHNFINKFVDRSPEVFSQDFENVLRFYSYATEFLENCKQDVIELYLNNVNEGSRDTLEKSLNKTIEQGKNDAREVYKEFNKI